MHRLAFSVALLFCLAATAADAWELRWGEVEPSARSDVAQTCTLSVWTAATDCPIRAGTSWRLVWVQDRSESKPTLLPEASASGPGPVDEFLPGSGVSGLGEVDTLLLSARDEACPSPVARFQFDLPARPRITALLVVAEEGRLGRGRVVAGISVGDGPIMPPIVTAGRVSSGGASTRVTMEGFCLHKVKWACWVAGDGRDTLFATVVAATSSRAILDFASRFPEVPNSIILAQDDVGRAAIYPVHALTLETSTSEPLRGPVVRFHPSTVDLPPSVSEASLGTLVTLRSGVVEALADAGVVSLRRLLPTASTTSSPATNLLGEPILPQHLEDIYVATLAPDRAPESAAAILRAQPWVMYADASPNTGQFYTSDPYWPIQWGLRNDGSPVCPPLYPFTPQSGIDVGVLGAWPLTQGVSSTRIGVPDAGFWPAHPDLPGHAVFGPDFTGYPPVDPAHGNGVLGIIAAVPNNNEGLAGIAPGITPVALTVNVPATWAPAIQYCVDQQFPIVTMSWGSPLIYEEVTDVVRAAFERGLLLIAASGNQDDAIPNYPAAYSRFVTTVTAVSPDGRPWREHHEWPFPTEGNSIGPHVDVAAPGGRFIISASDEAHLYWYDSGFGCADFGGTSAAAPAVAAVAGLVHSYASGTLNHVLLGEDIARILELTANDILLPPAIVGKDQYTGWGLVKADEALGFITPPRRIAPQAIGYVGGHGTLAVTSSLEHQTRIVRGVPGLLDTLQTDVTVVTMEGTATFSSSFTTMPAFWVRSSGTLGWSDTPVIDYFMDSTDGRLVSGSLSQDGAVLRTTIYWIPGYGWFPVPPDMARIAYVAIAEASNFLGVDGGSTSAGLELRSNPARGQMILRVGIPHTGPARLVIYDVMGREVRTLIDGHLPEGLHEISWDGHGSDGQRRSSGVYFCRLEVPGATMNRRVIYLAR